jgi:hypothetical protein
MAILFTFHHVYWPPLHKQIVLGTATVLYSLHYIFQQLVDLTWAANEVVSTKSKDSTIGLNFVHVNMGMIPFLGGKYASLQGCSQGPR